MKLSYDRLAGAWERMPFLRALLFLCAGILFARWRELPLWFAGGGFAVCGAMAYVRRSPLYVAAALFCFGIVAAQLRMPGQGVPQDRAVLLRIEIDEAPVRRGSWSAAEGTLLAWRDAGGVWHPAEGGVAIRCDSAAVFRAGERIVCRGRVRPFPENSYGRLMRARGYAGSLRLPQRAVFERDSVIRKPGLARRLHAGAVERMGRLPMKPQNRAVAAAMAAGDRSGLTPQLRRIYARTGISHLLAVSGLHVGVVFLGANLLLWSLPLFRRGHRWRHAVVIGMVWLYAAATGLTPSVVRAATTFTLLQLSFLSTAEYAGMNALAAAAFMMLVADARWLFDISFQLSFVAVAGILAWGMPLLRRLRTGNRVADLASGLVVVGMAASLATAPLVAHAFGTVSPAGVVLNPAVVLLAEATVALSAVWMAVPISVVAPVSGTLIDWTAGAQNRLAEWAACWPSGVFEVELSAGATAVCYLLFVAVTLFVWSAEPKKTVSLRK